MKTLIFILAFCVSLYTNAQSLYFAKLNSLKITDDEYASTLFFQINLEEPENYGTTSDDILGAFLEYSANSVSSAAKMSRHMLNGIEFPVSRFGAGGGGLDGD